MWMAVEYSTFRLLIVLWLDLRVLSSAQPRHKQGHGEPQLTLSLEQIMVHHLEQGCAILFLLAVPIFFQSN